MKNYLLWLLLLMSTSVFAQLETVSAELNFIPDSGNTSDSLYSPEGILRVKIQLNDSNDLGALTIRVFRNSSNNPDFIFYGSKSDLISQQLLADHRILVQFPNLANNDSYSVFIEVQNADMMYMDSQTLNYTPN